MPLKDQPRVARPDENKVRQSVRDGAREVLKPFLNRVKAQRQVKVSGKVKVR